MEQGVRLPTQQIISQLVRISNQLLTEELNCPINLKLGLDNLKTYLMKFSSIAETMRRPNVKKPFILEFLPYVLAIICDSASNVYLSRAVLELMITALEGSDIRIIDARITLFELCKLIDLLDMCGDYVLQEMVLKFVTQLIDKNHIETICTQLFPEDSELQAKFSGILMERSNFELESRNFLNFLNSKKSKHVVSIFCKDILFGDIAESCSDCWVDFNEGSHSISFFCKNGPYPGDIMTITVWDIEDKKCFLTDGLLHFQIHMANTILRKTQTGIEETLMPQITFVMEDDYESVLLQISANFFEPTEKVQQAIENRKITKVIKTAVIFDQPSSVASECSVISRIQSEQDLPLVPNVNDDNPLMSMESDKFYTPPIYVVASPSASNSSEYLNFTGLHLNVLECSIDLSMFTKANENNVTSNRRHFINVVDDTSHEIEETSEVRRKNDEREPETLSDAAREEERDIAEIVDDSDVTPENIVTDEERDERDESVEDDLEAMQDLIKLTGRSATEKQDSSNVNGEKETLKKDHPDRDAREKCGTKQKVGVKKMCYVRIPKNEQEIVLQFISQNTKGIAHEHRRETESQASSQECGSKETEVSQEFDSQSVASTSETNKSITTEIDTNEEFGIANELHASSQECGTKETEVNQEFDSQSTASTLETNKSITTEIDTNEEFGIANELHASSQECDNKETEVNQEFDSQTTASTSETQTSITTKIDSNGELVVANELHASSQECDNKETEVNQELDSQTTASTSVTQTSTTKKIDPNEESGIANKLHTDELNKKSHSDEETVTVGQKLENSPKSSKRCKRIRVTSDSDEEHSVSSEKSITTVTDEKASPSRTQRNVKSPYFRTKQIKVDLGNKETDNSSSENCTNDKDTHSIDTPTASPQPKGSEGQTLVPTGMENKSKTKRKRKLFDPSDTSYLTIMTNDVSRTANESKVKQCVSDESSQNLEETTQTLESEETTVEKAKRPKLDFEIKEKSSQREQLTETKSDTVRQNEEEITNELEVRVCSSDQVENVELDELSIPLNEDSNETVLFSRSQLMRNISCDGNKSVANESCETVVNEMLVRKVSPLKSPNQQTTINSTDTRKASEETILNEPTISIENTVGTTEVGETQFSEDNNQIDEKYRFPPTVSQYILDLQIECRKIHARKERREREKALKRNQRNKRNVKRKPARKPKQDTPKAQKPRIPLLQFKTDTYLDNTREISETEVELLTTNEREIETAADAPASISLLSAEAAYLSPPSSGAVVSELDTSKENALPGKKINILSDVTIVAGSSKVKENASKKMMLRTEKSKIVALG